MRHRHDIVVIGASLGGVEALRRLMAGLPRDLPASLFAVVHTAPRSPAKLAALLSQAGGMPAHYPRDGEPIERSALYVAPPDRHLLVTRGKVLVRRGPRENYSRPAIDPLFRSAAVAYGPRVIGVVLTGRLEDGTAGLLAVTACGGVSVAQAPEDALASEMPRSAIAHDHVEHIVPLAELPDLLRRLVDSPAGAAQRPPADLVLEVKIAAQEAFEMPTDEGGRLGRPSLLSCPDCGGVLNEIAEGSLLRFRCQVGHAYGAETLAGAQVEGIERDAYMLLRTLQERRQLCARLAEHARQNRHDAIAERWEAERARADAALSALRENIRRGALIEETSEGTAAD